MLGLRWLCHLSLHCFPSLPGITRATSDHFWLPILSTSFVNAASSSGVQGSVGEISHILFRIQGFLQLVGNSTFLDLRLPRNPSSSGLVGVFTSLGIASCEIMRGAPVFGSLGSGLGAWEVSKGWLNGLTRVASLRFIPPSSQAFRFDYNVISSSAHSKQTVK